MPSGSVVSFRYGVDRKRRPRVASSTTPSSSEIVFGTVSETYGYILTVCPSAVTLYSLSSAYLTFYSSAVTFGSLSLAFIVSLNRLQKCPATRCAATKT